MKTLFIAILFSFEVLAVHWPDLELNQKYRLTQAIHLKQIERSGSMLELPVGNKFLLKEITGLDMIKVTLFELQFLNCPGPAMKTEMDIVAVRKSGVEVGVQVEEGCELRVYIENKDIMSESFFE